MALIGTLTVTGRGLTKGGIRISATPWRTVLLEGELSVDLVKAAKS